MGTYIVAIGISNPVHKVPQSKIFEFMAMAHELSAPDRSRLKKLYDGSGIEFRHSVLEDYSLAQGSYPFYGNDKGLEPFPDTVKRGQYYEKAAADLCVAAVNDCIRQVKDFNLATVTHLITVSCTGMHAPGIDIELVEKLGLNKAVERTCINFMGCYGAFNALKAADYICRSSKENRVLVVDVELCTLHFQKQNTMDNWLANSLFADGASCVLLQSEEAVPAKSLEIVAFHAELFTEAREEMGWKIGNYGFEMKLGNKVSKKIKTSIGKVAQTLLAKAHLTLSNIDLFAIHPGGRRILEVCEEAFGIGPEKNKYSYGVLKAFGNMSSATVLFVLHALMSESTESGKNILSFAFGPGLTFESMVLRTA